MQRRRPDSDGKMGAIRQSDRKGSESCVDNELATQFAKRCQLADNVSKTLFVYCIIMTSSVAIGDKFYQKTRTGIHENITKKNPTAPTIMILIFINSHVLLHLHL